MTRRTAAALDALVKAPHAIDGLHEFERLTRRMSDSTAGMLLYVGEAARKTRCEREGLCLMCPRPRRTKAGFCLKCARRRVRRRS